MATVQKRGDTYRIIASCGYDLNGKQIRRSTTWKPEPGMTARQIEKELDRQKVLFEEKCRTGQVLDGAIKFAAFAERWFTDYAEKQLRPKTLARYRGIMPRINAAIGHIRLDKLQPHHLMAFYDNLEETGIRNDAKYLSTIDFKALLAARSFTKAGFSAQAGVSLSVLNSITQGKNISAASAAHISETLGVGIADIFQTVGPNCLSSKTILHHHRLISSILSTAVKWQVIFSNPCERVDPPKIERKEARYLDEEQTARLLEALEDAPVQYRVMVSLLLYTGLRRGELCGLEWRDIDFAHSVIRVCRTSLYLPEKGIFEDGTKNETSNRSIKAPASAISMLKEYRTWQLKRRMQMGDQWEDSGRLFTNKNGKPIHPDILTNWFHKFVQENDLPSVSIHSLRHTNATLLIAAGTNLQTVANRLGHANVTTTGKIYAHAIKSADAVAAETLQDILHPARKKA